MDRIRMSENEMLALRPRESIKTKKIIKRKIRRKRNKSRLEKNGIK